MSTPEQIATVAKHYIIAALWADCEEGTHPRATKKTEQAARDLCAEFIAKNETLFGLAMERGAVGYGSHPDAGSPEAAFGHDLWLTTRGHGCGFWDCKELDAEDLGAKLLAACDEFGEPSFEFYRGWMHLYV
jgi:hypothetical protein